MLQNIMNYKVIFQSSVLIFGAHGQTAIPFLVQTDQQGRRRKLYQDLSQLSGLPDLDKAVTLCRTLQTCEKLFFADISEKGIYDDLQTHVSKTYLILYIIINIYEHLVILLDPVWGRQRARSCLEKTKFMCQPRRDEREQGIKTKLYLLFSIVYMLFFVTFITPLCATCSQMKKKALKVM